MPLIYDGRWGVSPDREVAASPDREPDALVTPSGR
ncbi:hypothetical protein J2T11_001310 [Paenarthrobacter nicotinovorans]|nr:hypothetical protein [Paenarthrobacter nicotinovorans]